MPENVFKTEKRDDECNELNLRCKQPCVYGRNKDSSIFKVCILHEMWEWETEVYLRLLDTGLFPANDAQTNVMVYGTKNMVSVKTYLMSHKNGNTTLFFNELFSFVNTFKAKGFVHGNLHMGNIFVKKRLKGLQFAVIDYANSYLLSRGIGEGLDTQLKRNTYPKYDRTSYMGEYNNKLTDPNFIYWDLLTLYVSLKTHLSNQASRCANELAILDKIMSIYIQRSKLTQLLSVYLPTM